MILQIIVCSFQKVMDGNKTKNDGGCFHIYRNKIFSDKQGCRVAGYLEVAGYIYRNT